MVQNVFERVQPGRRKREHIELDGRRECVMQWHMKDWQRDGEWEFNLLMTLRRINTRTIT
jgi:hypothetical protein